MTRKLDAASSKEACAELAVCELAHWAAQVGSDSLDIPPCQIRLLPPAELVSRVLAVDPRAYDRLDDERVAGQGLPEDHEEVSPLLLARPRPPPGSLRLVQLLRESHSALAP